MKKIVHIITGLESGGAENMLLKLLRHTNNDQYYHEVISMKDEGVLGEKLRNEGIVVHTLELNRNIVRGYLKAIKICKNFDIINTWLYHADLLGYLVAFLLRKKIIWNIRHSNLEKSLNKSSTLFIAKINSILSKKVDCITFNSRNAINSHLEFGYRNYNMKLIPNGFELENFKYDAKARMKYRTILGLSSSELVLITVGRWDPQKDYYTLIRALKVVKERNIPFKMLMIGSKLDKSNVELLNLILKFSLHDNIQLLGRRDDINKLLSAADIYISSSKGESFSNSIGEAMSCELHCIVTDVGDSKLIVGEAGEVINSGDYLGLANKIEELYREEKYLIRNKKARKKVVADYDIKTICKIFESNFGQY